MSKPLTGVRVVALCGTLLTLLVTCAFGQEPKAVEALWDTYRGERTGYYWLDSTPEERIEYIVGFADGHAFARPDELALQAIALKKCRANRSSVSEEAFQACQKAAIADTHAVRLWQEASPMPRASNGEVREATDRFFAEPENRVFPISSAWRVFKKKKEGRPQKEIDALMDDLRDTYIRDLRRICEKGGPLTTKEMCHAVGTQLRKLP